MNGGGFGRRLGLLLVVAVVVAMAGCGQSEQVGTGAEGAGGASSPSTTTAAEAYWERCYESGPEAEDPDCVSPEEQRDLNLRYADRVPFEGDEAEAARIAEEVRVGLATLAATSPQPTVDELRAALVPWKTADNYVDVSSNAVRTAGTTFGISTAGGCVFGAVSDGQVSVEIGGYINDGGCLASYGH